MPRIVLDTNVLVSALISSKGNPAAILEGILDLRWEIAMSPEIIREYEEVLLRPRLGIRQKRVRETIHHLQNLGLMVIPIEEIRVCSDPDDDKFVTCGFASKATHLITGNIRHFPKGSFQELHIVTPAQFIQEYVL